MSAAKKSGFKGVGLYNHRNGGAWGTHALGVSGKWVSPAVNRGVVVCPRCRVYGD